MGRLKVFFAFEAQHLGVYIQIDGGLFSDAIYKARQGMAVYSAVGHRVFGSLEARTWLKYQLLHSLVLSRLLFNAHLVVPMVAFARKLQFVDMRESCGVLRAIVPSRSHDSLTFRSNSKCTSSPYRRLAVKRSARFERDVASRTLRCSAGLKTFGGLPDPSITQPWIDCIRSPEWRPLISRVFLHHIHLRTSLLA